MRRPVVILLFTFALGLLIYLYVRPSLPEEKPPQVPKSVLSQQSLKERDVNTLDFEFKEEKFKAAWLKITNSEGITLFPNFNRKLTAEEAFNTNGCKSLVSGGFYTKEGKPVGLFVSNYNLLQKEKTSSLFNGVFSINDFNTPRISRKAPRDKLRLALQTGPLIVENSFQKSLSIKNDKPARRLVAAITGDNQVIFLIIYKADSVFSGPYLSELPDLTKLLEESLNFGIADAINLDGGTASAFYAEGLKIPELSPIGSYFCLI